MNRTVAIAGAVLGVGQPCFVIAEAGVNHNGDVSFAHKLIDVAADARVDAIKFQTFDPEKLVAAAAPKAEYQVANTGEEGTQLEMLRRLILPKFAYPKLMQHATDRGLVFLSTPFEEDSADFLDEMHVPAFKISSGDLTNHPFLAHVARKGRAMLVSTGMGPLRQVEDAVKVVEASGNPPLALFHCVTNYPAAAGDCNLRAMQTMSSRFGVPVGWSDHTEGMDVSLAAVALGANILEKHFTLSRALPGPDHLASLEPPELATMVSAIRRVEAALGDGKKEPKACEVAIAAAARKSLHWKYDLRKGATIAVSDLMALRPGTGISPANVTSFAGRRVARDVRQGQIILEEDLERNL